MMKAIISGVPGAGKSSTCERIKSLMKKVKTINFGDMVYELSVEKHPEMISTRESIRELPRNDYLEIQKMAARRIAELDSDVIIDTHLSLKTSQGFYPGLPKEVLEIIRPDVIVILEPDPVEIYRRRLKDRQEDLRNRDQEDRDMIAFHMEVNRLFGVSYSALIGCYLNVIDLRWEEDYPFHHADVAAKIVVKLFD
ncbi:MAG: adenylate kinase [Candidatus Hodarchaeota archaeon]